MWAARRIEARLQNRLACVANDIATQTDITDMNGSKPVVLVNHLLEPPTRLTGITRYLFSLLPEMVADDAFQYVLLTTWPKEDLPAPLRTDKIAYVWAPYVASTPLNIVAQMRRLPEVMRRTGAVLHFNCNPLSAFSSQWPTVITVHDLYFELRPQDYRWHHQLWWHLLFPRVLDAAAGVICVSESNTPVSRADSSGGRAQGNRHSRGLSVASRARCRRCQTTCALEPRGTLWDLRRKHLTEQKSCCPGAGPKTSRRQRPSHRHPSRRSG